MMDAIKKGMSPNEAYEKNGAPMAASGGRRRRR